MKNYIEYDEEADVLVLRKVNETIVESINDRYICLLGLNEQKQIIGLEFLSFRKTFQIPLSLLNHLADCDVHIHYEHEAKLLSIRLKLFYKTEKETISLPVSIDMGQNDFILSNFAIALA